MNTITFDETKWKLVPVEPTPDMEGAGRVNMAYGSCTARQVWSAMLAAAPSQEPAAWVPHLVDRADGVKGHYAIGRWNPRGFREVWNLHTHRWAAYSDDVMSLEEADSLLRQITIPTIAAAPSQPVTLTDEVPKGFIPLQRENGKLIYAACLDGGRYHGWLMWKHPDGQWVTKRKMTPTEIMQAEDQDHYGIVQDSNITALREKGALR